MHKFVLRNLLRCFIFVLVILMSLSALLCGCSSGEVEDPLADVTKYEDLNDQQYRIGVVSGTTEGPIVEEVLPNAQLYVYNTDADLYTALETGKVDAIVTDGPAGIYYNMTSGGKLRMLDGYLKPLEFGYLFAKDDEGIALCDQVSEFITKLDSDGTLEEINSYWLGEDAKAEMPMDYTALPATNGTLTMATSGSPPPFTYLQDGIIVGIDIDIISRFCKEYGYGLEITVMDFTGIIPAVQSGKADLGGAAITITEERKESVNFSAPYYAGGTLAAVRNVNQSSGKGFFAGLKESLDKTFIREGRYKLFIQGILTTLLITLLSALFGTLLGFLVYMLCRGGSRLANVITKVCVRLIQMLPVVVILLIFYYIIFASAPVEGVFVSVVVFTLIFAASVYDMLCSSVSAIDAGQTEAAYALGFNNLQTFFKVILPQAMRFLIPTYKGELVSLIKATAIVGYIAVQDLTRTGDLVRSRTYEAFFPIISVAIIYFLMACLIILLINKVDIKTNPKLRSKEDILKGVKTDD